MNIALIISILILVISCNGSQKSGNTQDSSNAKTTPVIFDIDTTRTFESSINKSSDERVTITVSYAAIACGCPQWFETKFKDVKLLEGVERFYLEPVNKDLINANALWDGKKLPLILKVTGRFSKEKELPVTYHTKGEPEKAKIFWYDTIIVASPSSGISQNSSVESGS